MMINPKRKKDEILDMLSGCDTCVYTESDTEHELFDEVYIVVKNPPCGDVSITLEDNGEFIVSFAGGYERYSPTVGDYRKMCRDVKKSLLSHKKSA